MAKAVCINKPSKISTCANCPNYNYGCCTWKERYVHVLEKIPDWCPLPDWRD